MAVSKTRVSKDVRVIVVEDNPKDRELLTHELCKAGLYHHVQFIKSGKKALEFLDGPRGKLLAGKLMPSF